MRYSDQPNLFKAADKASNDAQKNYLWVMRVDLLSGIIGAGMAIYNISSESRATIYLFSAIFLFVSLVMTVILIVAKFEDAWYKGRALAESCKTLTWRFITCSESFEKDENSLTAKATFISRLNEIKSEYEDFVKILSCSLLAEQPITNRMLEIRTLSVRKRLNIYIEERIKDQIKWYTTKAEYNKTGYQKWFCIIIISQIMALVCAIALVFYPNCDWNMVGLFSIIAASAISWLQLKRHQELKQAYTITVFELNQILTLSGNIGSESLLSKFVLDSENAISREHTLWIAQRRR